MKVTLAYPYDGHKPDATVDLPDADATRLLADGRARLAAPDATPPNPTPTTKSGSGRKSPRRK